MSKPSLEKVEISIVLIFEKFKDVKAQFRKSEKLL